MAECWRRAERSDASGPGVVPSGPDRAQHGQRTGRGMIRRQRTGRRSAWPAFGAQHGQRTGRRAPLGMIRRQRNDASGTTPAERTGRRALLGMLRRQRMAQHGQRTGPGVARHDPAQHGQRSDASGATPAERRQRSDASGPGVVRSDARKTSARRNRRDALTRAAPTKVKTA